LVLSEKGIRSESYPCPDWYATIQAAKYLGFSPEAVLDMPIYWKDKALLAMTAEAEAAKELEKRKPHQ
jgi:hypothetical protein